MSPPCQEKILEGGGRPQKKNSGGLLAARKAFIESETSKKLRCDLKRKVRPCTNIT